MDLHAENRLLAPIIQTARFTLRPVVPADADRIIAALNDWNVTRWLTNVPFPYHLSDVRDWIDAVERDFWVIDPGDGLVGVIDVIGGDLGYWLAPAAQGRGYITEAARAVLDTYFEQSETLVSGHYPKNLLSRAVQLRMLLTPVI